jgi:iron complex outermembrane recepter protein
MSLPSHFFAMLVRCWIAVVLVTSAMIGAAPGAAPITGPEWIAAEVQVDDADATTEDADESVFREASLQPQPQFTPTPQVAPPIQSPPARGFSDVAPGVAAAGRSARVIPPPVLGVSRTTNQQALLRASTDAGNLLGESPSVLGISTQRRTSIITDTRIRGDRVGVLAASGSYWVPARLDMDTALSKFDSYNIESIAVIKGPYTVLAGPGRNFVEFDLLPALRFEDGPHSEATTGLTYKTNGEQWHGRQNFVVGGPQWGARVDYNHRTGSDYVAGNDAVIPASYKSRELLLSLGYTFEDESRLDFHYLRLDQTDVELPGQALDIDFLATDGFELTFVEANPLWGDSREFEAWHNRTRFEGDNLRASKRRQFPVYDLFDFRAATDVDSASTGASVANVWGDDDTLQLLLGVDVRYVKQELNEISSGRIGIIRFVDANSPVPRSDWTNPGLFAEVRAPLAEDLRVTTGARFDYVHTDVLEDPDELEMLGTQLPQASLADIVGSGRFSQDFHLILGYVTAEYTVSPQLTLKLGGGHGERAPNLTELYAAQPFMFLLQNGLNIVTGDPRLKEEKAWQVDLGARYDAGGLRLEGAAFHAWVEDYITFENMRSTPDQVDLKFVNTDLATLAGVELSAEWDVETWLTPFATLQYVAGRDRTRRGDFATRPNSPGMPSERVPGLPRGSFSGVPASDAEPLPGIAPLESRLGIRLQEPGDRSRVGMEIAARVVDNQDRVATSLRETPTPGFTIWDLRVQARPRENLTLIGGVENILDRTYREHLDFRPLSPTLAALPVFRPGVNFYFGSELRY